MSLPQRPLGAGGPLVSAVGLGCMSMSWAYHLDRRDDDESVRVIRRAMDRGVTHLDTAVMYGPDHNEVLVGRALAGGRPADVVVAPKAGLIVDDAERRLIRRDGRPETLRRLCDDSLRRLGVEQIDLYYLHRIDPDVALEESWGALADLVSAGKVCRLGLSECTVGELERAAAVHPVAALQSEFSLWTREPLDDVIPWCEQNGVAFVAFGVLGRGFLTGAISPDQVFEPRDFRYSNPRFQPDAMRANLALVEGIRSVAERHGASLAAICVAWTLAMGDHILAIPGTKRAAWLDEDVDGGSLRLSPDDMRDLAGLPAPVGNRYAP